MKIKSLDSGRYLQLEPMEIWGEKVLLFINKSLEQEMTIPLNVQGIDKLIYHLQKEKEKILK